MNGIALHGGLIPYGGTFLVFTDYCRPAIRLAALMGNRVIFVMTHDSIGLGEDGPTHQPVEHLAALRAIPNLLVFRPADAMETAECWQLALERDRARACSRSPARTCRRCGRSSPRPISAARGAYELAPSRGDADVTLFATGSEVEIALGREEAARCGGHRHARVVSVPVLRAVRRAERGLPGRDHRHGAGQGRDRGGGAPGLGSLHRHRRHLRRHGWLRRLARPTRTSIRHFGITAEAVAKAALERLASAHLNRRRKHGRQGRHQRVRPDRTAHPPRHRRIGTEGHRGGRHQRSRPGRDQCPSAPLRFGPRPLPARGEGRRRHDRRRRAGRSR